MVAASSLQNSFSNVSLAQLFVYGLLFLQLAPVAEAGKFKNFCTKLSCWSKSDDTPFTPKPLASTLIKCPNRKAPKDATGWNIYKNAKPMPRVEDIVADIKLCGLLSEGTSTVFYSFAGGYTNAQAFIKKHPDLNGKTINDVLPESWYDALGQIPGMSNAAGLARTAWIARTSQALAAASSGNAYLVADPSANIYTVPWTDKGGENAWKGPHNVWYDYEFATLQRNPAIDAIYTVNSKTRDIKQAAADTWVRSPRQGEDAGNHVNANTVTPETLKAQKDAWTKAQEEQAGCGEPSNSNVKRAGSSSGSAIAACTLQPKTTSSSATGSSMTVSASSTPSTISNTGASAAPTTLVTRTSKSLPGSASETSLTATSTSVTKSLVSTPTVDTSAKPTSTKPTSAKPSSAAPTSAKPTSAKPTSAKATTTQAVVKPTKTSCPRGKKRC
ncbi:hypothetical protein BU23DRAFT_596503 [Bimuria novae-zelandiae CBS 107.79]|uniref:Uncharacterized protein n=1 Tax=Bimuria novae-zelandiae CBS 107.79 TaxID=1447943 RepID=A0A6A5VUS3_9PLEO|nr:hypothetical protein BU23DRAFT_596503 [Bimuria novae-zelandiae CBS 107.79]